MYRGDNIKQIIKFLSVFILCLGIGVSVLAATPADTVIRSVTLNIEYTDGTTTISSEVTESIDVTVDAIYGISVSPQITTTVSLAFDETAYYHHIISNQANTADAITYTLDDLTTSWAAEVYFDDNNDGIHQASENTVATSPITIAQESTKSVFIAFTAPSIYISPAQVIFHPQTLGSSTGQYTGFNGNTYGGAAEAFVTENAELIDGIPPDIIPLDPTANDSLVPVETDLVFLVTDNIEVVTSSLIVTINGELTVQNGIGITPTYSALSFVAVTDGYQVSIDPTVNFNPNEINTVNIYVEDLYLSSVNITYIFETASTNVHNLDLGRDYTTIQGALNDAEADNTIAIDAGVYDEGQQIEWPNVGGITLTGNVGTTRGAVVISGGNTHRVIHVNYLVSMNLGGLTIKDGSTAGRGGGIYLNAVGIILNIDDMIFTGNSAGDEGGAIAVPPATAANINAINSIFSGNSADDGGVASRGTWTAYNCQFQGNSASTFGGAGFAVTWQELKNCIFSDNYAGSDGGVMYAGNITGVNNTYRNNSAFRYGGVADFGSWHETNSIFWNNTAGGSIQYEFDQLSSLVLVNCLVSSENYHQNCTVVNEDNLIKGVDPEFFSDVSTDAKYLDLSFNSPAINAGTENANVPTIDSTGIPRGIYADSPGYDLGAFEYDEIYLSHYYPEKYSTGNSSASTDISFRVRDYNYPSANMTLTLTFDIEGASQTILSSYSIVSDNSSATSTDLFVVFDGTSLIGQQGVTINVTIDARIDPAATQITDTYWYRIEGDTIAPTIQPVIPTSDSNLVPTNTPIIIYFEDISSLIATDSVQLTINGVKAVEDGIVSAGYGILNYEVSNNTCLLALTPNINFDYYTTINVEVSVADKAIPSQNVATLSYAFKTVHDPSGTPKLDLRIYLQGYYDVLGNTQKPATISIQFRTSKLVPTDNKITLPLNANGETGVVDLVAMPPGSYYIYIAHKLPSENPGVNHIPIVLDQPVIFLGTYPVIIDLRTTPDANYYEPYISTANSTPIGETADPLYTEKNVGGVETKAMRSGNIDPDVDNAINITDFKAWRLAWGWEASVSDTYNLADLNADGVVDTLDFALWNANTEHMYPTEY